MLLHSVEFCTNYKVTFVTCYVVITQLTPNINATYWQVPNVTVKNWSHYVMQVVKDLMINDLERVIART